jgi:hypothetical protein
VRAGEHPMMDGDQQLAAPREGARVGVSEPQVHGVAIAGDQIGVGGADADRPVAGQDATRLVDGRGDAFQHGRGGCRLGFKVAARAPLPDTGQRALRVKAFTKLGDAGKSDGRRLCHLVAIRVDSAALRPIIKTLT